MDHSYQVGSLGPAKTRRVLVGLGIQSRKHLQAGKVLGGCVSVRFSCFLFFGVMPSGMLLDQVEGEADVVSTQSPPSFRNPGNRKSSS